MNLICVICTDSLTPVDEVYNTPCGHIFHHRCLIQWLKNSNTCPQCREKTTIRTIHRIYFNTSHNDPIDMRSKIDSLTNDLCLRNHEVKNLTTKNTELQKQVDGLKKEVKTCSTEITKQQNAIYAFKDQIEFYKQLCANVDSKDKQLKELQIEIKKLKSIQALIDASVDELDSTMKMTYATKDPTTLLTYISVMKREMTDNFNKRRELREKVQTLQEKLRKVNSERMGLLEEQKKRMELEEIWLKQENEKIMLQTKLHDMHIAVRNCICNKISNDIRKCLQDCKEHSFKETSNTETIESNPDTTESTNNQMDDNIITSSYTENIPQNLQSQDSSLKIHGKVKRSNSNTKVPLILTKKAKISQRNLDTVGNMMSFDGFGGHVKRDKYPTAFSISHLKYRKEMNLTKQKLGTSNNKNLSL